MNSFVKIRFTWSCLFGILPQQEFILTQRFLFSGFPCFSWEGLWFCQIFLSFSVTVFLSSLGHIIRHFVILGMATFVHHTLASLRMFCPLCCRSFIRFSLWYRFCSSVKISMANKWAIDFFSFLSGHNFYVIGKHIIGLKFLFLILSWFFFSISHY